MVSPSPRAISQQSAWQSDMTQGRSLSHSPFITAWSKNIRSVSLLWRAFTWNSSYGGTGSVCCCCFAACAGSVSEYLGPDSKCGIVRYVSLVSMLKRGGENGSLCYSESPPWHRREIFIHPLAPTVAVEENHVGRPIGWTMTILRRLADVIETSWPHFRVGVASQRTDVAGLNH